MTLISCSTWRNGWSWEWTWRFYPFGGARSIFLVARCPGIAFAAYAAWHRDEWWPGRKASGEPLGCGPSEAGSTPARPSTP